MCGRPRKPFTLRVSQLRGSPLSMRTTEWRNRASQIAAVSPAGPPPMIATSNERTMPRAKASSARDVGASLHLAGRQHVQKVQRLLVELREVELRVLGIHDRGA